MKKTRTHKSIIKNLWTYALAFLLVLSNFTGLIQADGPDPQVDPSTPVVEEKQDPAEESPKDENTKPQEEIPEDQTKPLEEGENSENPDEEKTIEEDTNEEENDGLEISDRNVKPAVTKTPNKPKKPSINPVSINDKKISGGGLVGAGQRNTFNLVCKIHVTIKDAENNVKETKVFSIQPSDNSRTWNVNLDNPVKAGYTVTAKQEFGENNFSDETSVEVKQLLAPQYEGKLSMPTIEVWSEDLHVLEADAVEDIKKAFVEENNKLAVIDGKNFEGNLYKPKGTYNEKKPIDVAGNGTSITINFSDGSSIENFNISDKVTVKQITETSNPAIMDSLTVVAGKISGKISGNGPFTRAKVTIVKFGYGVPNSFCNEQGCTIDKNSSELAVLTVDENTGAFSYDISEDNLELGKDIGVIVKEYGKKNNCTTIKPELVTPAKTKVRNPIALTDEEKEKITEAIRAANKTENGKSKLPDGTGDWGGIPAYIEFDKDGNARIINPNNVNGDWENYTKFIPNKKADGSLDVVDETQVIKIPAKELVKNLAPEKPAVALSDDKKNITFTPNLDLDTDAQMISISYTGADGTSKTSKATKNASGSWDVEGEGSFVNGVFTLSIEKVKGGTDVTAKVTDNGGLEGDTDKLESDQAKFKITKAVLVEALGGLDPVDIKRWVGEDPGWEDGVKAKDSTNEAEVKKLLEESGTKYTDETETKRTTDTKGDFEGKIKVTFDDNSEIIVENQKLYVSNHVTSTDRKDKVPTDALEVEFKLGEGVKVNNTDGTTIDGNTTNPVSYSKYKVKPGTNLKDYKLPILNASVIDSIKLTAQDGYTDPVWKDSKNGTNFVAAADNNVFTATATKTFKVTLDPNSGSGNMDGATVKENGTYKLPTNTFTAPENMQFSGWQVGDDTTLKQAGDEITITGNTVIKAIWKPIESKVKFQTEAGASGTMEDKTVDKGSKYELPEPTFTPEEGKEFAGWKVGDGTELKKAGDEIDISGDITLTATWKDIEYKVTFDGNKGSGTMTGATVKKGKKYKLPDNTFGAPSDKQEFKTWEVDGKEVAPGTEITVDKDTKVKAIWKYIEYKVTFNGNTGTGNMDEKLVKKGNEFELPANGFIPPANKEFNGWMVGNEKKSVGDKITVNGDTEVKAIWKDKPAQPNPDPNPCDTPGTNPGSNPGYYPDPTPNPTPNPNNPNNNKDNKKDEPKKPDTPTPPQPGPGKEELPVNPKPDGTQEITPDPDKTDEVEVTVTPDGKDPEKAKVEKDKDGNWITDRPDILKVDPKTGKITVAEGVKDVRAIATLKLERGLHERYLYGYVDGTVRPEGFITRCEAAALIARLANLDMTNADKPNFPDTPSAWYNTAINAVVAKNLMFADANGNFRPQEPITRGEFARALYYIDRHNDEVAPFEDIKGHIYEAAINQAYGNGLINGYLDGTFKPDAPIQRAEATKILNKYANRGVDHDGLSLVRHDLIHFTDIDESHWAYYEIMEAANTHEYERVVSTLYETWLKIIYDRKIK